MAPGSGRESWRVRVRDGNRVLGAGVLLGNAHVLTCAHVVAGASQIMIDVFCSASVGARIMPECWAPPLPDGRGDLALLDLDQPQSDAIGTTLTLTDLYWNQPVRTHGFPAGLEDGVYARAMLSGSGGPGGEWLQLNGNAHDHPIVRGFSGAGVVDEETGAVLGIVVSDFTDKTYTRLAWMLPARTILEHLPCARDWVTHPRPDDPLAELSARYQSGAVIIIAGPERAMLRRWIALSSGELLLAAGEAPERGSIDIAVDATGMTARDVAQRIVEHAGGSTDESADPSEQVREGIRPMTIAIDGVDAAEHPDALLNEVVAPLLRGNSRVVLGFDDESSPSLTFARDLGSVERRLAWLEEKITALRAAELALKAKLAHVRDDTPTDAPRAATLWRERNRLRKATSTDERLGLESVERTVAEALRRTAAHARHHDDLLAERDELRGRLKAYKAKAVDSGRAEDIELSALYRRAYELLWRSPTHLPTARQAVRDYERGVRG